MSLHEQLRELVENSRQRIPADVLEIMLDEGRKLQESGVAERALGVGDAAPRFRLPNALGEQVALDDLLADGPVVLSFYRGAWCPYCNTELRALQQHVGEFASHGARLVAVSPQIPDESVSLREKHGLSFDVLSDIGSQVARRFGVAIELSERLGDVYDRLGFDLARVNDGHARTLPLPATYVVDRAGVIRSAFVDADYRKRAEPADILKALADLE